MALLKNNKATEGSAICRWRKVRVLCSLTLACLLRLSLSARAAESYSADQIKAAYIYHFTQFVEWPSNMLAKADAPITIAIVGADSVRGYLEEISRNTKGGSHPINVLSLSSLKSMMPCHMIYFGAGFRMPRDATKAFEDFRRQSILTVGETDAFLQQGGIIQFHLLENKIRLKIRLHAAESAGLKISSKLLRVADVMDK